MGEFVRLTLADQAYQALHLRILNGDFAEGERLFPEALASTMLISPTPIKEALVRLQTEGLVDNPGRRGAVVRRFRAADVRALYESRLLIEQHALTQGMTAGRVTADVVAALTATNRDLNQAVAAQTLDALREALRLDRALHAGLVALAENAIMAEWHGRLMAQTHTIRVYGLDNYGVDRLQMEHAAILEAMAANDLSAAIAALREHLTLSSQELQSRQNRQFQGAEPA